MQCADLQHWTVVRCLHRQKVRLRSPRQPQCCADWLVCRCACLVVFALTSRHHKDIAREERVQGDHLGGYSGDFSPGPPAQTTKAKCIVGNCHCCFSLNYIWMATTTTSCSHSVSAFAFTRRLVTPTIQASRKSSQIRLSQISWLWRGERRLCNSSLTWGVAKRKAVTKRCFSLGLNHLNHTAALKSRQQITEGKNILKIWQSKTND